MSKYASGKSWSMPTSFHALCILALSLLICTQTASGQAISSKQKHSSKKITSRAVYIALGTLYFIPFGTETFNVVSPNTIKRSADEVISLDADHLAIFYRIISGTYGRGIYDVDAFYHNISEKQRVSTFDTTHTRLRLDAGKEPPLFIDNQGIVLCNHIEYSLTPLDFVRLDHFVASLSNSKQ